MANVGERKRFLSGVMCLFHSNSLCPSRSEKPTIFVHVSVLVDRVQPGSSSSPHPSKRLRNIIVIIPTAAPHPRYQPTIVSPGPPTSTDKSKVTHQAYTYYPYNAHSHSTHTPSYNATHYPLVSIPNHTTTAKRRTSSPPPQPSHTPDSCRCTHTKTNTPSRASA